MIWHRTLVSRKIVRGSAALNESAIGQKEGIGSFRHVQQKKETPRAELSACTDLVAIGLSLGCLGEMAVASQQGKPARKHAGLWLGGLQPYVGNANQLKSIFRNTIFQSKLFCPGFMHSDHQHDCMYIKVVYKCTSFQGCKSIDLPHMDIEHLPL
jgi:hypothetical protein